MKIAQKYSHLNGEEYLIVHKNNLYEEIAEVIESINANEFLTKESKEKTMPGKCFTVQLKSIRYLSNSLASWAGMKADTDIS